MRGVSVFGIRLVGILACAVLGPAAACAAAEGAAGQARPDSVVLRGGQSGTVFRTLTVQGEDRVHLEIDRPSLKLDLDPATAPGLDLGGARDVLDRTRPDLVGPLLASVPAEPSPYTGRPWLDEMATGPVARFRPKVTDVASWQLVVTDSRGNAAATFEGKGKPPAEIDWDGRGPEGSLALPGLNYSYMLEARDRAGNVRHFMGEGFQVPAYRRETDQGPVMVLAGDAVDERAARTNGGTAAALLDAASRLNQAAPTALVEIAVTGRTHQQAAAVAQSVHEQLEPQLVGDAARIRERVIVEPEAPAGCAVVIRTAAP